MSRSRFWKIKDPKRRAQAIMDNARSISDELNLEQKYLECISIAQDRKYSTTSGAMIPGSALDRRTLGLLSSSRCKINVVQNLISTLISKIGTYEPRSKVVTDAGNWHDRMIARKLEWYLDGVNYKLSSHREKRKAFVDALVGFSGFIKVGHVGLDMFIERIMPHEVLVDESYCMGNHPRTMYHQKWVPVDILIRKYPKSKNDILESLKSHQGQTFGGDATDFSNDVINIVETWTLPSEPGATDGQHNIAIGSAILESGKWERMKHPIVKFDWTENPVGYYGVGLVEQLYPLHVEVNTLADKIKTALHLNNSVIVLMEEGAAKPELITNELGTILTYGQGSRPPVFFNAPVINNQYFQMLGDDIRLMHDLSGVSVMSSTGGKEQSYQMSAAAGQLLRDVQSERFADQLKRWEQFNLDIDKLLIEESIELYDKENVATDFEARYITKNGYEQIRWSDVAEIQDRMVLKIFSTNSLPSTPAGRLTSITQLLQLGMLTPEIAAREIELTDMQDTFRRIIGPYDVVERQVYEILDKGREPAPMPYQNLQYAVAYATEELVLAEVGGASEDKLDKLRTYILKVKDLISQDEQDIAYRANLAQIMQGVQTGQQAQAAGGIQPVPTTAAKPPEFKEAGSVI